MPGAMQAKLHERRLLAHIVHDHLLILIDSQCIIPLVALMCSSRKLREYIFTIHFTKNKQTLNACANRFSYANHVLIIFQLKFTLHTGAMRTGCVLLRKIASLIPSQVVDSKSKCTGKDNL